MCKINCTCLVILAYYITVVGLYNVYLKHLREVNNFIARVKS